jgi:hypothetical protein
MVDEIDLGREFFTLLEQLDEGVARRAWRRVPRRG